MIGSTYLLDIKINTKNSSLAHPHRPLAPLPSPLSPLSPLSPSSPSRAFLTYHDMVGNDPVNAIFHTISLLYKEVKFN